MFNITFMMSVSFTLSFCSRYNWRMASLDFQEQESLSAGEKFLRQGKPLYKENRENLHKGSNKPIRTLIAGVMASVLYFFWYR